MKAVILAGGLGIRISEETHAKPKPMVEIGMRPILWHIMKIYSAHGINDFVVCCGYRGGLIKEYFANYFLQESDITFDIAGNRMEVHERRAEPWRVTLVNTGARTETGGRLKRVRSHLESDSTFCFTYGDGLGNIDITALIDFHEKQGVLATLTAVQPAGRFGALSLERDRVVDFEEKPRGDGSWISGGFFVLSSRVLDYIEDDRTVWEHEPLTTLAREGQLSAYRHHGFWRSMDSLRDMEVLDALWRSGDAPWRIWQ